MRIVVTGAAGFLGSHLSDRLLAEGLLAMSPLLRASFCKLLHNSGGRYAL